MVTETRATYQPETYPEFDEGSDRDALRALRAFLKAHRQLAIALNTRESTATGRAYTRKATLMAQVAYSWSKLPVIPRVTINALYMHPSSVLGDPLPGRSIDDERKRIDDWRARVYGQIGYHYGVSAQEVARKTNQALKDILGQIRSVPLEECGGEGD